MDLVMRINGAEIARQPFSTTDRLSQLVDKLRKQYKDEVKRAEPEFFLEGMPSSTEGLKNG